MIIQFFLIIQTIFHGYYGETPVSICSADKPFEKSDNTCGDFSDICVKKDDSQCNNFQAACKQCPPTNYTVSALIYLKNQIDLCNQKIASFKGYIDDCQKKVKALTDVINTSTVLSTIIICLIQILVTVFIIKYKTIVEFISSHRKTKIKVLSKGEENRWLLHTQGAINELKDNESIVQKITKINNEKEYSTLDSKNSTLDSVSSYKLRFQIADQFEETELFVSKFDNVIKLKKSICDRNMNTNDYKRMIMKYKNVTLDNNQYLLSYIDSTNNPIFCEFDNNVDVNAMIVIKLKCDNIYPEMLQIWKHQQIKDVKIIISKLNKTNHKDLLIVYKSTKLDDDDKTIDDYKIEDNDWIQVVNKFEEIQNISMKSIFTAKEKISIEFSKLEKVSDIIDKSIKLLQHNMTTNHFAVFLNNKLLQNDKFIYEYNIDSKSLLEFCYFKKINKDLEINKILDYGQVIMYVGKYENCDKDVLIKSYNKKYMRIANNNDLSKILKKDLQMFQITKSHPRFIQLFGIYVDKDCVYLELDYLREGLMKTYLLSIGKSQISNYQISKWAYQMLEGLKFLHDHNLILKDMTQMSIWIDGNLDIKLPCFNSTEYLNHLGDNKRKEISLRYEEVILTCVAPEILEGKPYEASADVWSFGAIMIEVATRAQLFPGLNESEVVEKIKETHTIEYDKTNISPDLVNFIDCCVKGDPKERATIDQLMKMEFIEKYLLIHKFY